MKTDLEIAVETELQPIEEIVNQLDLLDEEWEPYGKYKAKLSLNILNRLKSKADGNLILVTSINPTPAGEGKSTVTVGLGQALHQLGKKTAVALREPSLGPVMGLKGGATGGGYSQVVPMEDINLHFTGDIHAITATNNALAALIDNHIFQVVIFHYIPCPDLALAPNYFIIVISEFVGSIYDQGSLICPVYFNAFPLFIKEKVYHVVNFVHMFTPAFSTCTGKLPCSCPTF